MDITENATIVCSDPRCGKPVEGFQSRGGLCYDCDQGRRYEEASRVQVDEFRVVKVSKRNDAETVLMDWTADKATAATATREARVALRPASWDVRLERRRVDHPLYLEVAAAERYEQNCRQALAREAERMAALMEKAAGDVRRRAADWGWGGPQEVAREAYSALTTVVGNAHVDTLYVYAREVEGARAGLAAVSARLAALNSNSQ